MPRIDSEKFYLASIEKYGINAKGVNWVSQETQELRFDIILDMLPKNINTLVDAGCGFGDFYQYLQNKNIQYTKYIGIDSLHKMCTIASKNTKQEIILADITKDKLPFAEYYICSGAMNILNTFETHLFIKNCLQSSQKAFIFNILHGSKESDTFNYFSIEKIEKIAKDLNVNRIEIRDDYMQNDVTVGFFL
jgi:SAM-dependent methyltransferase